MTDIDTVAIRARYGDWYEGGEESPGVDWSGRDTYESMSHCIVRNDVPVLLDALAAAHAIIGRIQQAGEDLREGAGGGPEQGRFMSEVFAAISPLLVPDYSGATRSETKADGHSESTLATAEREHQAAERPTHIYPFHQTFPGPDPLFHVSCREHTDYGFCGTRVEADADDAVHLEREHTPKGGAR